MYYFCRVSHDGPNESAMKENHRIISSSDKHEQPSTSSMESKHPTKRRRLSEVTQETSDSDSVDDPDSDCPSDIDLVEKEKTTRKQKSYKQKFKSEWKKKFAWLESKMDKPYFAACNKIINGGITHLKRYETTSAHQENINKASHTPELRTFLLVTSKLLRTRLKLAS